MSFFSIRRTTVPTQDASASADTPTRNAPNATARAMTRADPGARASTSTGNTRTARSARHLGATSPVRDTEQINGNGPRTPPPTPDRPGPLAGLRKRSTGFAHVVTDAIGNTFDHAAQKTPRGPMLPNHPIDARFVSTIGTGSKGRPLVPANVKAADAPKPLDALPSIPEEVTLDALASMRLPSASSKPHRLMQKALGRFNAMTPQMTARGDDVTRPNGATATIAGLVSTESIASLAALRVAMQQQFFATAPRADGGGTRELESEILQAARRGTAIEGVAFARATLLCDALSATSGGDANRARQILQRLNAGLQMPWETDDTGLLAEAETPAHVGIANRGRTAATSVATVNAANGVTRDAMSAAALASGSADLPNATRDRHASRNAIELPIELVRFGEGIADRLEALPAAPIVPAPVSARIDTLAWRTAQRLARTNNGYACLQAIAGTSWPKSTQALSRIAAEAAAAAAAADDDDPEDDFDIDAGPASAARAPRQWLRAADALVDAVGCDAHPRAVASAAARHSSVASRQSGTTASHASAIIRAAATVWQTGSTARLSPPGKGALLAARQGFFTDGPGTPFAATKSRLAKFVNHSIPRASAGTATDSSSSTVIAPQPVSVAQPRSRWAAAVRPFGLRKTAVASMRKGIQGANLGTLKKDRQTLDDVTITALTALHAALNAEAAPPRPLATSRIGKWMAPSRALRTAVSDAELSVLAETPTAYGTRIDDDMLDRIATRTADTIAALPAPSAHARFREKRIHRATQALHRELTADPIVPGVRDKIRSLIRKRLTNGSDVIDFAKLNAWQQRIVAPDADLQKSMQTIERIGIGAATRLANDARRPESDDYRQMGDDIIDHLESGGKAIFTEGGKIGLSTRGLTATIASFSLLSPRLNVAASEGREASFEISRSTASYKIGMGTRDRLRMDVGGGVQIGHNFGIVRLSSNLEAEREWDRTRQRGIELHIARRLNANGDGFDDDAAKPQLKEINRFLFEQAGRGRNEQDLWDAMGERFFEHDDFSVAWNDQAGMLKRNRQTANARVGVKLGTGKISARANINAAVTHDHVYRATMQSIDASGQMQTESHRVGAGHRIGLQTAANFTLSDAVTRAPHDATSEPTDIASVAMFAPNLVSFEVPLFDGFRQAKVTLVREQGKTQVHASNADTEFANVDDYARALRSQPAWALAFGMAATAAPNTSPMTRDALHAAIRTGQTKIEAHLAELKANPLSNLRHVLRVRVRRQTAEELDAIDDLMQSAIAQRDAMSTPRSNDVTLTTHSHDATIARLTAKRDALLRGPNAWIPTELLTVQSLDRDFAAGVRMGLQVEMRDGARGEHELASVKLKPNEADALDTVWPTAS